MNLTEPYEFDVFVQHIDGTRVFPYIARILGANPQYCFKRRFLKLGVPEKSNDVLRFPMSIGLPGVYEVGVNRKDQSGKQISHDSCFFCLVGPECFAVDIKRTDVMMVLKSLTDSTTKDDVMALIS